MNIIVSGGLGHIGSLLIRRLLFSKSIKNLIVIDNISTQRYSSLFNIKNKIKLILIEKNVQEVNLKSILKKNDIFIHLSAITNAAESFSIKNKIFLNNFDSTKYIADSCRSKNAKLIFISSTSVYGSGDKIMYEDRDDNLKPQSPYAECKIKEENYIKSLSKKLKFVIFRFGTIVGTSPGMRFHTAVNRFCWQASHNQAITVWKYSYTQCRPYLDLSDAIKVFEYFIFKNLFNCQIYNVVTFNKSVKDIIDLIKIYKKKIKINFVKNTIMNQLSYSASREKIIKTGFVFRGNLKKSIKKIIKILN
jgi:nucleoside-diphosphate-sugar epimerase